MISPQNLKKMKKKWQRIHRHQWPSGPASAAARPTLRFSASWKNAPRPSRGYERRNLPCGGRSWRFREVRFDYFSPTH